jgi:hypothetical protein
LKAEVLTVLSYRAIQNKPHVFQSLSGLKVEEFEQLLLLFEQAWITLTRKNGHSRRVENLGE